MRLITAADLRSMLDDGTETAVLDVREEGVFARDGHILLAANLPLSHLEIRARPLLPRQSVRIVVCDDGGGLGRTAAARLMDLGYPDVSLLDGGVQAWVAGGHRTYSGMARLAAADASRLTDVPVKVLEGGTEAWRAAGFELEAGDERLTGTDDDVQYRSLDRRANVEAAIREYLSWEIELLTAVESDPDFNFRRFA